MQRNKLKIKTIGRGKGLPKEPLRPENMVGSDFAYQLIANFRDENESLRAKIIKLEGLLELKEKERKDWADMCIKQKQQIERLEQALDI